MSSSWQELLPGIPHDITLTHISTKLPWRAFHVLSSVSRTWQRAIQSREVYGERIRCHSTETLIVVKHGDFNCRSTLPGEHVFRDAVVLYSVIEKKYYRVPPIPHLPGISWFCQFISCDGKLYVCSHAWSVERTCTVNQVQIHVYVLDLAAQMQWRECKSSREREAKYAVSIGCSFYTGENRVTVRSGCARVFDSLWSFHHRVNKEWGPSEPLGVLALHEIPEERLMGDSWRVVVVQGRKYQMRMRPGGCYDTIYVQDAATKSWIVQHFISNDAISTEIATEREDCSPSIVNPLFVLAVNNELFAIAGWETIRNHGYELLQSRGFGTERKEIVWERVAHSFQIDVSSFSMCTIQL